MYNTRNTYIVALTLCGLIIISALVYYQTQDREKTYIDKTIPFTTNTAVTTDTLSEEPTEIPPVDTVPDQDHNTWSVYTNDTYGFELRYPDSYTIIETGQGVFTTKDTTNEVAPQLHIGFTTEAHTDILAREEIFKTQWETSLKDQPENVLTTEIHNIMFAGVPAKEFLYHSPVGFTQRTIIMQKNSYTVILKGFVFNQEGAITFAFTK